MAQINLLAPFHPSLTLILPLTFVRSRTTGFHGWAEFFCKEKISSVYKATFIIFFCKILTFFVLHCRKHGTENPSVDFRIPDENFAMQNSRFPVPPHPCGEVFSKTFNLHFRRYGNKNPSMDFWIPDENFAMQNSRLAVLPHPNEHNNDSARCGDFFWIFLTNLNLHCRKRTFKGNK